MRAKWLSLAALMAVWGSAGPAAPGAVEPKPLEPVALGKARTELLDRVRTLPLTREMTVGDWASRDVAMDRELRLWVRTRAASGSPRFYSDQVCEVDAAVTPAELRDQLLRLLTQDPDAAGTPPVTAETIRAAAEQWPVLYATGVAAPAENPQPARPAGWENVTSQGVELARRAAEADAFQALLDLAGGLKVTHAYRLREFLASSPAVREGVEALVRRDATVKIELQPDQVAEAQVRIGMREFLRILVLVHEEQYRGDQFQAKDFQEMGLLAGREDLTATGLAAPPDATILRTRAGQRQRAAPEWAAKKLQATGRGAPAAGAPASREAAVTAARQDALAALRRQAEGLPVQPGVTLAEFVGYHPDVESDIALFLSAARPSGAPRDLPDGGVEVQVELPLRRLWDIVRRGLNPPTVEASDTPATEPAASQPAPTKEQP